MSGTIEGIAARGPTVETEGSTGINWQRSLTQGSERLTRSSSCPLFKNSDMNIRVARDGSSPFANRKVEVRPADLQGVRMPSSKHGLFVGGSNFIGRTVAKG